jgi:hypothetical protein
MPLPPLQWRRLPTRIITTGSVDTSYFLDTIYDMLTGSVYYDGSTRVIGSGSAWRNTTKFITGSNTEAVYTFPATNTEMSQSIIFAAKNYFGASSSASPVLVTNTSPGFDSSSVGREIGIASVKLAESQSFSQWTSAYPFGSSSFSTGYSIFTKAAYLTNGNKITIYEGTEAMMVVISFINSYCHVALAGAIIDPEQTVTLVDAESDNRIYGVATSGIVSGSNPNRGLNPLFMVYNGSESASLFTHLTSANTSTTNNSKFVILLPQAQSTVTVQAEKPNYRGEGANQFLQNASLSGGIIQIPIKCLNSDAENFLGRLRDINQTQFYLLNQVIRDTSNNVVGFTISSHEYYVSEAFATAVCLSYN